MSDFDMFDNIAGLSSFRETCIFCNTIMQTHLTNFIVEEGGIIPILDAPLKNGRFDFKIKLSDSKEADVFIEPKNNTVIFSNYTNGELPNIDENLVKESFERHSPYIEVFCPNDECGLEYHYWSHIMKLHKRHPVAGMWFIKPSAYLVEVVKVGDYVLHNEIHNARTIGHTYIFSSKYEEAKPIEVPPFDLSTFNKQRLIRRIQTLVTFS